ncbi:amidase [Altererythrobacter confluentis]|uniref:Amidase n=1 Tax=Allopontixanthobacter confluentis TaxID=1849021 RepID=A0A6L7GEG7_9SPHN|nr:amidase family protein [Allopontixanthobacter confluentis]MXP14433.1 amidase [Allopontixanthobacter confluentis]
MVPVLTKEPGALALAQQIRAGELSPLEAVDAAISRIEALDGAINAVVVRDFDRARDAARALDGGAHNGNPAESQPLRGVPMTIKESFDIAGLPTTWGHERFAGNVAAADATVVRQLKAAGAIFLGKTNVPPDLADWQATNPVYGRTCNPHDVSRSPGGSSGGSAAAVASGMVPIEYGTDIGGSVRVPAHFCGIWGHKTSWGIISKAGHDHPALDNAGHDQILSIAGPLARNPEDLALLVRLTTQMPLAAHARELGKMRLLYVADHPSSQIDASVSAPIEAAIAALEKTGAIIDRHSNLLPDLADQHAHYMRMLGIAMARGAPGPTGSRATATDWFDLLDVQARNEAAWARLFEQYDFVLAPPANILAFEHNDRTVRERTITINGAPHPFAEGFAWAGLATFPNLPSTVLPVGSSGGLPCGMQIIGTKWSDLNCIDAASQIADHLPR